MPVVADFAACKLILEFWTHIPIIVPSNCVLVNKNALVELQTPAVFDYIYLLESQSYIRVLFLTSTDLLNKTAVLRCTCIKQFADLRFSCIKQFAIPRNFDNNMRGDSIVQTKNI